MSLSVEDQNENLRKDLYNVLFLIREHAPELFDDAVLVSGTSNPPPPPPAPKPPFGLSPGGWVTNSTNGVRRSRADDDGVDSGS